MRTARSFTLVELLIALIIIGILVALAISRYEAFIWRSRYAEVYDVVNIVRKAEEACRAETGHWAGPYPGNECWCGNGVPGGSTQVQKDLGISIPQSSYFFYLIYPSTDYPDHTRIYFKQPGFDYAWTYDYQAGLWERYGSDDAGGPAQKYFVPPSAVRQ